MKKRGISLIVLVITIIVIVILGTAVIVTFAKNNPIETAKIAVLKGDAKTFNEELTLTFADKKLNDKEFDPEIINAASVEDMKKYIPSFSEKYYGKLCIVNGKLAYVKGNVTENEKTSLEEVGLVSGSYITEGQINDIKDKALNIPEGTTTTDISEYIEGVPTEQAEKFTIHKGRLYYRYEKTTYDERVSLHAAGIPFLPGDANEDGTLTDEDPQIMKEFIGGSREEKSNNVFYVCDLNSDGAVDMADAGNIKKDINGYKDIFEYIDLEKQDPERIRFIGDYKLLTSKYGIRVPNDLSTSKYSAMVKYIPDMTKEMSKRFTIIKGNIVYRYETLNEKEIALLYEYRIYFNLGDANFDGYVDDKDSNICKAISVGESPNELEKIILDIDGDGYVDASDATTLKRFTVGTETFYNMISSYFNNKSNSV